MVSMLVSSAVDHGFDPRSVKNKDCNIGTCCFSTKHVVLRSIDQRLFFSDLG